MIIFSQRGTLHDELERRKASRNPMPQPSLVTMFHSISLAVRELHSASPPLAHRDIKVEFVSKSFIITDSVSASQYSAWQRHDACIDGLWFLYSGAS